MRTELDMLADEVLSQLELKETRLLNWGILGGLLDTELEVHDALANPATDLQNRLWTSLSALHTEQDVINNLRERKLLFSIKKGGRKWSFTRYAETIRLLYLLKQRFSKQDWQSAPNLVSNIRFNLNRRYYPLRDRNLDEICAEGVNLIQEGTLGYSILDVLLEHGQLQLARFQERALNFFLKPIKSDAATIVGAGTGSGKTKAFYLPALVWVSEQIQRNPQAWMKVMCLYPRVELLKDQLKEFMSEILKIGNINSRPVSAGAFFGDVPFSAQYVRKLWQKSKVQDAYICSYLVCPNCKNNLVWTEEDIKKEEGQNARNVYGQHEILRCENPACGQEIRGDVLRLTRAHMRVSPPDFLFSTTEMLNRRLFDNGNWRVFGVGTKKAPRFVLLDEVHMHNGINGAHVAYLLRRWRNMVRHFSPYTKIHFVGLSATLPNAQEFIMGLTGVSRYGVNYITPADQEMTAEGLEYNLIVRGDPMSASALLSTSVQTVMLVERMLDPAGDSISCNSWGSKIFGFADKLDVLNRWHRAELDAENKRNLAQFRSPDQVDPETKIQQHRSGQIWKCAKLINPDGLTRKLVLDTVSSQNKGVNPNARLVLATSTLEVGYDDLQVGAVVQHKTPHDRASMLQRKGRAGRMRGMRPWTIVVTSAYGRDRWAYENPEQFFSPNLPELALPIGNSYVQHIQTAFAFMDWLTIQLNKMGNYINVWDLLTPGKTKKQQDLQIVYNQLELILKGDTDDLTNFIAEALNLSGADLNRVLWSPPRSLMLDLVPFVWQQVHQELQRGIRGTDMHGDTPLSGYVPRNLFSDLELRELVINYPGRIKSETMSLLQGINELAPGNATRRFSYSKPLGAGHWLGIPLSGDTMTIPNNLIKAELVKAIKNDGKTVRIYTPVEYQLEDVPGNILDTSTGNLAWNVCLEPFCVLQKDSGQTVLTGRELGIGTVVEEIRVYANEMNESLLVTRYATTVNVDVRHRKAKESGRRQLQLMDKEGSAAALGISTYVDAIAIHCCQIDVKAIMNHPEWNELLGGLRSEYYLYLLKQNDMLNEYLSTFEIGWMAQICLSSCLAIAISKSVDMEAALNIYRQNIGPISQRTIQAIFKTGDWEGNEEEGKLVQRLKEYIQDESIINELLTPYPSIYLDLSDDTLFWEWLKERYHATVAVAILNAINHFDSSVDTDELMVDFGEDCIWISEPYSGGMGVVTAMVRLMQIHKTDFSDVFWHMADFCPRHETNKNMSKVIANLNDLELGNVLVKLRDTNVLNEQEEYLNQLQQRLYSLHIPPTRDLIALIVARLVNQSSDECQELMVLIHEKLHQEQQRLQCVITPQVFGVAALRIEDVVEKIDQVFSATGFIGNIPENAKSSLVESLLYSDCTTSCPDCLELYGRFQSLPTPCRSLLLASHPVTRTFVTYGEMQWEDQLKKSLESTGKVLLRIHESDLQVGQKSILERVLQPVEIGYELFYPYLHSLVTDDQYWIYELRIGEVLYG